MLSAPGTYKTYAQKRRRRYVKPARRGYTTVARSRGVYAAGEMKYLDTERSATAIPANATWQGTEFPPNTLMSDAYTPNTICVPVVGSAINQRIGREVKVHKIAVTGTVVVAVQGDQTAGDAAAQIRIALVQDTQTNAAQAQGEQIFQPPVNASAVASVNAFQSLENLGRFRVLKDKRFIMQNPNVAYDGTNIEQQGLIRGFKFVYKPKKPISVRFNSTNGGTIADIVDHSWCVYAVCASTALAPTIQYQARCYYKE